MKKILFKMFIDLIVSYLTTIILSEYYREKSNLEGKQSLKNALLAYFGTEDDYKLENSLNSNELSKILKKRLLEVM